MDIPAGATNGKIYVFDPGFCDTSTSAGTGENWTIGENVRTWLAAFDRAASA